MMNLQQKGFAHILLLLLLIIGIVVGIYLVSKQTNLFPKTFLPKIGSQDPSVSVKTEYKNPFEKSTQYVNPFDQYKSPLANLKK